MASASAQNSPQPPGQRRERTNVAAQACETCRTRKTRCDETRPTCGLCRRLSLECVYREPLPTKKDKTMVHILESLTRLELKVDRAINTGSVSPEKDLSSIQAEQPMAKTSVSDRREPFDHVTPPHKVILWPAIYIFLANTGNSAAAESQNILQQGTAWFLQQERAIQARGFPAGDSLRTCAEEKLLAHAEDLCAAYFDNFNVLMPILDKDRFVQDVLHPALQNRCRGDDKGTVLTWLVLALGEVASHGVFSDPVSKVDSNVSSGIRGGTVGKPPGLDHFNEARKRLGFVFTDVSLETVQIMLLMASYYESSSRHLDFWKSAVSASITCQALLRGQKIEWTSYYGHAVKRVYWACILNEMFYHHDLDFPQSGIEEYQEQVPAPSYYEDAHNPNAPASDDRTEFTHHFLAMLTLRQIISRLHECIHGPTSEEKGVEDASNGPRSSAIKEMAQQLESWRSLLPGPLQWQDNDRFAYPNIGPQHRRPMEPLFTSNPPSMPIGHRYNFDVMVAQLRTRYYYARFMIFRPYIWKALHMDEQMSAEDRDNCAVALKAALQWPITMAPPKNKKRLVPHHFTWTQNFIGILLILRMRSENDCLRSICEEQVNEVELRQSIALMLEWIRDMKQVDGIADWGWRVLEPLYA